jgi:transcription antitermination factor NusA-like protein
MSLLSICAAQRVSFRQRGTQKGKSGLHVCSIGRSAREIRDDISSPEVSVELPLPAFLEAAPPRELSEAAAYLRELLLQAVPNLDIVSVARRPGVQSKLALRTGRVPGDVLARLRDELGGERIDIIRWNAQPEAFIASALGLAEVPPTVLKPAIRHAIVLVGEIDVRGLAGWRGINRLLASAATGWRIQLRSIADTPAWSMLSRAMAERRAVNALVVGRTARGVCVELSGLYALMPRASNALPGQELQVRITRMDADEGKIIVSRRLAKTGQLPLPH